MAKWTLTNTWIHISGNCKWWSNLFIAVMWLSCSRGICWQISTVTQPRRFEWIHFNLFTTENNIKPLKPFLARDWPVPPGSGLFAVFPLIGFLGGGHLLRAVQERAQGHSAEHVSVGFLNELHQLADVTVQTLGRKEVTNKVRVRDVWIEEWVRGIHWKLTARTTRTWISVWS